MGRWRIRLSFTLPLTSERLDARAQEVSPKRIPYRTFRGHASPRQPDVLPSRTMWKSIRTSKCPFWKWRLSASHSSAVRPLRRQIAPEVGQAFFCVPARFWNESDSAIAGLTTWPSASDRPHARNHRTRHQFSRAAVTSWVDRLPLRVQGSGSPRRGHDPLSTRIGLACQN